MGALCRRWWCVWALGVLGLAACDWDTEGGLGDDDTTAAVGTGDRMRIEVDLEASAGTVQALNAVQGGPAGVNDGDPDLSAWYLDAEVPLVRLPQDDGFSYTLGGVFPDVGADPEDPASYVFGPIDASVQGIVDVGAQVLWEATYDIGDGDTWDGCCMTGTAPSDLETWADVVEHVLMHFNDGWADGHDWSVRFVESINEPFMLGVYERSDFQACWDAFAALSRAVDRYNARTGRDVQVVGFADPILSLDEGPGTDLGLMSNFLQYVATNDLTLDVFSYHSYSEPGFQADIAAAARTLLDGAGFEDVALWNSEWNNGLTVDPALIGDPLRVNAYQAASEAQTRILLQEVVDQAVIYRGNKRGYHGEETPSDNTFFSDSGEPMPAYYGWLVFRDVAALTPVRVDVVGAESPLVAMASRSEDGAAVSIVLANWEADPEGAGEVVYEVSLSGLSASSTVSAVLRAVDYATRGYDPVETGTITTDGDGVGLVEGTIPASSVHYWQLEVQR